MIYLSQFKKRVYNVKILPFFEIKLFNFTAFNEPNEREVVLERINKKQYNRSFKVQLKVVNFIYVLRVNGFVRAVSLCLHADDCIILSTALTISTTVVVYFFSFFPHCFGSAVDSNVIKLDRKSVLCFC